MLLQYRTILRALLFPLLLLQIAKPFIFHQRKMSLVYGLRTLARRTQAKNSYQRFLSASVTNTQKSVDIDLNAMKVHTELIQNILGVGDLEVEVLFCSESKIRKLNKEWRNVNRSTDILAFQVHEFTAPGVFEDPEIVEMEKHLGELIIAPAFVQKVCCADKADYEKELLCSSSSSSSNRGSSNNDRTNLETSKSSNSNNISSTIDQSGANSDDAGVSLVMETMFSVQERMPLLLIHGMLHLLGYDHETQKDWKIMTDKETEVYNEFKRRSTCVGI